MSAPAVECARCHTPLEAGDLLCAVCGRAAPAAGAGARGSARGEEPRIEVLRCRGCGAATRYDARERGLACAFCGSVVEREELLDPTEQTGSFLPLSVTRREAREALQRWLGRAGFFRPGDLRTAARLETLRPLWWVAWVFDAEALVSWAADSNEGARRADWAPHAGRERMVFDDVVVSASRGLTDEEAEALVGSYDLATAVAELDERDGDAVVEAFDVQRSQARARVLAAIEGHAIQRACAECVPGTRFRNERAALLLRGLVTRRIAFPAWVLAYRYREELYRVVISGQRASTLHGSMPISPWRVLGVVLAVLALAALAFFLVR